jgi:hypothetical protein
MDNSSNSSQSSTIIKFIIVLLGLIGIYYLYKYLYVLLPSITSYQLIGGNQSATMDTNTPPIVLPSAKLPVLFEGGEFAISSWIYISNWSYRNGYNKHILNIGGQNFDTIQLYLGGYKPQLKVRVHTSDSGVLPGASSSDFHSQSNSSSELTIADTQSEPLLAVNRSNKFKSQSVSDSSTMCDLPEIEIQRWINITVAVNGKIVDVYIDGKLSRSCVLPSYFKVDTGYSATLLNYGGFGGQIANTMIYDSALNPEIIYKNYISGPEPSSNLFQWIWSSFTSFFS